MGHFVRYHPATEDSDPLQETGLAFTGDNEKSQYPQSNISRLRFVPLVSQIQVKTETITQTYPVSG
jgi:hypothetical protein